MKTQLTNIFQTFPGISSLQNILHVNPAALASKAGSYVTPILKQAFRDSFMGSDQELEMILLFLQGYILSAAKTVRHNPLTDGIKKLQVRLNERRHEAALSLAN